MTGIGQESVVEHARRVLEPILVRDGYELVGVVDLARGGTLLDRVAALRQQLARDLGLVIPPVHVCDNLTLEPGGYRVLILGNEIGRGLCRAGRLLAVDPSGASPARRTFTASGFGCVGSSKMASTGQRGMHAPQAVHGSGSMTAR
jgi:flagellar biosynthesis component FlhA